MYLELSLINEEGKASLTPALIEKLLDAISNSTQTSAILIKGNQQTFCSGLDIEFLIKQQLTQAVIEKALTRLALLLDKIAQAPSPVIALVEGPALGGGFGLAAVADLILATPAAHFALPETTFGLIPAVVFPYIVRRIGLAKARLLALGGKPLTAAAAKEMGLVDELADDMDKTLKQYLKRFYCADPRANSAMKRLCNDYFAITPDYYQSAIKKFSHLLMSTMTQARIKRFYEGDLPWEAINT